MKRKKYQSKPAAKHPWRKSAIAIPRTDDTYFMPAFGTIRLHKPQPRLTDAEREAIRLVAESGGCTYAD